MSKKEAIFICGGASHPAIEKIKDIQSNYTSAFYIGVDNGAMSLIKGGHPLNLAVGDFDSVTQDELAIIKTKAKQTKIYPAEKDDTDMELALEFAIQHNVKADIYILGAIGQDAQRLDHLMANLWLVYQPRYQEVISQMNFIEETQRLNYLKAGDHTLTNPLAYKYLSLISMTEIVNLKIQGAKYNLNATTFTYPRALISNEFLNKQEINLSFKSGILMVMYTND